MSGKEVSLWLRYSSTADAIGHPGTVTDKLGSTMSQVQSAVSDAAGNVTQQVQSVTQRASEKVQETTSGAADTTGARKGIYDMRQQSGRTEVGVSRDMQSGGHRAC
eukprot:1141950-Pelagomonas_calceolata.AAC.6